MSNPVTTIIDYDDAGNAVGIACVFSNTTMTAVQLPTKAEAKELINRLRDFANRLENIDAAQFYSGT